MLSTGIRGLTGFLYAVFLALLAHAHPGHEDRIRQLSAMIEADPGSQGLYILRAAEYSRAEQWVLAERDFDHVRAQGGERLMRFEYGMFHYRQQAYAEAYLQFSRHLEHQPDDVDAMLYRARSAVRLDQADTALADYSTYFSHQTQVHPGDYLSAAKLLALHSENGREQALALIDQGLENLGQGAHLQRYAVQLELDLGRVDDAIDRWQLLQPTMGDSPAWKIEMAQLYLANDDPLRANTLLEQAQAQLDTLKPTPAREVLRDRIESMSQRAEI